MAHHHDGVTSAEIDRLAERAGIGERDPRPRKSLRLGIGRPMIHHGHPPAQCASRRRDGLRIRSGTA